MEHTFTDQNFQKDVLESDVPVFVDFWAPWCGPCRLMGPIIEQLAEEMDGAKIKIGKCNVDDNGATAMKFGIMSIPTMIVFKNGQIAEQMVGAVQKDALKAKLEKHFG